MLYFVVRGVAFDLREEAQEVAIILNAHVQPVDAVDELQAVCIATSLTEVNGPVIGSSRDKYKEEQADPPPPA